MLKFLRRKIVWMPIVGVLLLAIGVSLFRTDSDTSTVSFSTMLDDAKVGQIERIDVNGENLRVYLSDRPDDVAYRSRLGDTDLIAALQAEGVAITGPDSVDVRFKSPPAFGNWIALFISCVPLILFAVILYFTVRAAVRHGMREARKDQSI
jgi:ATP-dependent Zn protease